MSFRNILTLPRFLKDSLAIFKLSSNALFTRLDHTLLRSSLYLHIFTQKVKNYQHIQEADVSQCISVPLVLAWTFIQTLKQGLKALAIKHLLLSDNLSWEMYPKNVFTSALDYGLHFNTFQLKFYVYTKLKNNIIQKPPS